MPGIPPVTRPPEPPRDDYHIGEKIGGRYEILKKFGGEKKSGMGIVYVCFDHTLKDIFALKTFQSRFFGSVDSKNAFKREALTWINLGRHPNIVRAINTEEMDGRLFLVLEYIAPHSAPDDLTERNTLGQYLGNPILPPQVLDWGIQFCRGMEHAKHHGLLVHRDIKPDNIMISKEKTVKITDFGISQTVLPKNILEDWNDTLQHHGPQLYESPEAGKDGRSDIYSFGIVLHQVAAAGKIPFDAINITGGDTADIPLDIDSHIPELSRIIRRCLQGRPENRYQDFSSLRLDLEKIYLKMTGREPSLPAPSPSSLTAQQLEIEERDRRAWSFYHLGLLDYALREYQILVRYTPEDPAILTNLGMVLGRLGRSKEAIEASQTAISLNPGYAEAHNNLAIEYRKQGMYDLAISEYERTIQLNPDLAGPHFNLGAFFHQLRRYDNAIGEYTKATHLNPRYAKAFGNIGLAYYDKAHCGKVQSSDDLRFLQEAVRFLQEAVRLKPDYSDAYIALGKSFESLQDKENVIRAYENFIRYASPEHPDFSTAYLTLGILYESLKDKKNAIRAYENFIRYASPENPRYNLVRFHIAELSR